MEAPQYKGEEALEVHVYAGRVHGDLDEIELLNQYVGVHLPLDTPELAASPWVLGAFLVLALAALALPLAARRRTAFALCVLMVAVALGGGALLQYRLYEMGHERTSTIMEGVPDFTPPLLGSRKIANFVAHMSLGAGAWAYLGALILAAWSARRTASEGSTAHGRSPVAEKPPADHPPSADQRVSMRRETPARSGL